jgi:hypothetical protein
MAKRAPATRALIHVLRPNKAKSSPSGLKRARKKVKKGRKALGRVRGHKTRTTIKLIGKSPVYTARGAGKVIAGATNRLPARTRKRTVVIRSAGGRFAGSKSV